PGGPAPPGAPRGECVRPDDQVDRAVPAAGRGALPPSGRRPAHDAGGRVPPPPPGRNAVMTSTTHHETQIVADPDVPLVRIIREFDAPKEKVFRAHTDPELVAQWMGPRSTQNRIDQWDCRTGGSWRYVSIHEGEEYGFR